MECVVDTMGRSIRITWGLPCWQVDSCIQQFPWFQITLHQTLLHSKGVYRPRREIDTCMETKFYLFTWCELQYHAGALTRIYSTISILTHNYITHTSTITICPWILLPWQFPFLVTGLSFLVAGEDI